MNDEESDRRQRKLERKLDGVEEALPFLMVTPYEFRVLHYLAFREAWGCNCGAETVAKQLRMSPKRVRSTIERLLAMNLIEEIHRPDDEHGTVDIHYDVRPVEDWPSVLLNEDPEGLPGVECRRYMEAWELPYFKEAGRKMTESSES